MSAAVLKERKPDQAEMLDHLAQAVDLDQQGPEAQKIHAQLKASIWTDETRATGRKLGQDANALKASEARILWRKEAIKLIVDGYDDGKYIFRDSIIEGLRSYCFAYNLSGKGGGTIQKDTISRWFTKEREEAIRLEAISSLINRKAKP
jgi:hypothetical protein